MEMVALNFCFFVDISFNLPTSGTNNRQKCIFKFHDFSIMTVETLLDDPHKLCTYSIRTEGRRRFAI